MKPSENLTSAELEQLARAYLECRLSLLQEKELEYVLLSMPEVSGPFIDEARQSMRLSAMIVRAEATSRKAVHRRRLRLSRWITAAAACVAIGIGIGFSVGRHTSSASVEIAYACVDGRELSPEESLRIANEIQAETMAKCNELLAEARNESEQSIKLINDIKQYQ